jgi:hypothetical protein
VYGGTLFVDEAEIDGFPQVAGFDVKPDDLAGVPHRQPRQVALKRGKWGALSIPNQAKVRRDSCLYAKASSMIAKVGQGGSSSDSSGIVQSSRSMVLLPYERRQNARGVHHGRQCVSANG